MQSRSPLSSLRIFRIARSFESCTRNRLWDSWRFSLTRRWRLSKDVIPKVCTRRRGLGKSKVRPVHPLPHAYRHPNYPASSRIYRHFGAIRSPTEPGDSPQDKRAGRLTVCRGHRRLLDLEGIHIEIGSRKERDNRRSKILHYVCTQYIRQYCGLDLRS